MNSWIDKLEYLKEVLGSETVLEEMCRAIGSIEADETLTYIMTVWGIGEDEDEDEEES